MIRQNIFWFYENFKCKHTVYLFLNIEWQLLYFSLPPPLIAQKKNNFNNIILEIFPWTFSDSFYISSKIFTKDICYICICIHIIYTSIFTMYIYIFIRHKSCLNFFHLWQILNDNLPCFRNCSIHICWMISLVTDSSKCFFRLKKNQFLLRPI